MVSPTPLEPESEQRTTAEMSARLARLGRPARAARPMRAAPQRYASHRHGDRAAHRPPAYSYHSPNPGVRTLTAYSASRRHGPRECTRVTSVWRMGGNKMCSAHRFGSPYPSRMHCGLKALRAHHSHHKHCGPPRPACVRHFSPRKGQPRTRALRAIRALRAHALRASSAAGTDILRALQHSCSTADTKMRCGHIGPARLGEAALEGGPDTLAPRPHAA